MKLSKSGLFYKWVKFSINLLNSDTSWGDVWEPANNICHLFWQIVGAIILNIGLLLSVTVTSLLFLVAPWAHSIWLALSLYLLYTGIILFFVREEVLSVDSKLYHILSYKFWEREIDYDKEPNAVVKATKDFVNVGVVFAKSHKDKVCLKVEWED